VTTVLEAEEGTGQPQPPQMAGSAPFLTALNLGKPKVGNNQDFLVSPSQILAHLGSAGNSRHSQWRQDFLGDAFHDSSVHP
jgi:hypothetical protein